MSAEDYARAVRAIESLKLNGANAGLAAHWMSRWHQGKPPTRYSFIRGLDLEYRPAVMICEIVEAKSLRCLRAGAIIRVALGFDVSDQDLLLLTPAGEREFILSYWWQVMQGAVSVNYRRFTSDDGSSGLSQAIGLPLSDEKPNGARFFIMHTNWRPVGSDWMEGSVQVDLGDVTQRRLVPFRNSGVKPAEGALV